MRGATYRLLSGTLTLKFQSTRPMRGATLVDQPELRPSDISIHAPHAGRDQKGQSQEHRQHISIHAPHAGRDSRSSSLSLLMM